MADWAVRLPSVQTDHGAIYIVGHYEESAGYYFPQLHIQSQTMHIDLTDIQFSGIIKLNDAYGIVDRSYDVTLSKNRGLVRNAAKEVEYENFFGAIVENYITGNVEAIALAFDSERSRVMLEMDAEIRAVEEAAVELRQKFIEFMHRGTMPTRFKVKVSYSIE